MEKTNAVNQYCTFRLGDLFLGVDVRRVQEVIRFHEMTHVPLSPRVVSGLINLRGDIVTAINLRDRMAVDPLRYPPPPIESQMNIVIRTEDSLVALVVDQIGDILLVDERDFEVPPETLDGIGRQLITGTFKLKNQLLLIVDIDRIIELDDSRE